MGNSSDGAVGGSAPLTQDETRRFPTGMPTSLPPPDKQKARLSRHGSDWFQGHTTEWSGQGGGYSRCWAGGRMALGRHRPSGHAPERSPAVSAGDDTLRAGEVTARTGFGRPRRRVQRRRAFHLAETRIATLHAWTTHGRNLDHAEWRGGWGGERGPGEKLSTAHALCCTLHSRH